MTTMIFHLSCFVSLPLMTFALLNDVCETYLPESFQGTLSDGLVPFTVVPATLNYYPGKAVTGMVMFYKSNILLSIIS